MNRKYYELNNGRSGLSQINLASGQVIHIHEDTNPNLSLLGFNLLHVYNTKFLNSLTNSYGKGWKLSINQTLTKLNDDLNDTRHIYTDKQGEEHLLEEVYFYRENGKKVYTLQNTNQLIKRNDIKIAQDKRLWLVANPTEPIEANWQRLREVFRETKSETNYQLQLEAEGFLGSKKLEERHEELVRVQTEIKSLNRQIADIEKFIAEATTKIKVSEGLEFESLRKLGEELTKRSNEMESLNLENTRAQIPSREKIEDYQTNLRKEMRRKLGIGWGLTTRLLNEGEDDDILNNREYDVTQNAQVFTYEQFYARNMDLFIRQNQVNLGSSVIAPFRSRGQLYFAQEFQKIVGPLEEEIADELRLLEGRNFSHEKLQLAKRAKFEQLRVKFDEERKLNDDKSFEESLARAKEDLEELRIQLTQRLQLETKLLRVLPINYVEVNNQFLGFNKDNNLVVIFDKADNQIILEYDNNQIIRIEDNHGSVIVLEYVNNQLSYVLDQLGRRTYYHYLNEQLVKIEYPNGDVSHYQYNQEDLNSIVNPAGLGYQLKVINGKVSRIYSVSNTKKIDKDGIHTGNRETDDLYSLEYLSNNQTKVIDLKTNNQITYYFDNEERLIHEHSKTKFNQTLITDYKTDRYEITISQELDNQKINDILAQRRGWMNNPDSLPNYQKDLSWVLTNLNSDKNPVLVKMSAKVLNQDISIKKQMLTTFNYLSFNDERADVLKNEETTVLITNQKPMVSGINYDYDKVGNLVRTINYPENLVEETSFDQTTKISEESTYHLLNPNVRFNKKLKLSEVGQVVTQYDELGINQTVINYLGETNLVLNQIDPKNTQFNYGLNPQNDQVNGISVSIEHELNSNTYQYVANYLVSLKGGNTQFNYSYDSQGRISAISLNNEGYVTYSYETKEYNVHNGMGVIKCEIITTTLASSESFKQISDIHGRLLAVHYLDSKGNEKSLFTNYYEQELLVKTIAYKTSEIIKYHYDLDKNLVSKEVIGLFVDDPEVFNQYIKLTKESNIRGQLTSKTYQIDEQVSTYQFEYDNQQLLKTILPNNSVVEYRLDDLIRMKGTNLLVNDKSLISNELSYVQVGANATHLINSNLVKYGTSQSRVRYQYDQLSNITQIISQGKVINKYEYDGLSRLVKEISNDVETTYEYDSHGNLLYKISNDQVSTYQYDKDQLINYNDELFEYDKLGNPTVYRNHHLEWSLGRELVKFNEIDFEYEASGLRNLKDYEIEDVDLQTIRKQVYYRYLDEKLIKETRVDTTNEYLNKDNPDELTITTITTTIDYLYDELGVIGFILDDEKSYYYVKNIFNDVEKIIDEEGRLVAEYSYDAWGNHEIITNIDEIGSLNPIRYRSYYYDVETKLYYLKSRYYDSEIGRFINLDTLSVLDVAQAKINGLNLYAYCLNNPVNMVDDTGDWPRWLRDVLIGVAIVGLVALTGGVGALVLGKGFAIAGAIAAKTAVAGLKMATTTGIISVGFGTAGHAIGTIASGGTFGDFMSNLGSSTLDSFGNGFMLGAAFFGAGKAIGALGKTSWAQRKLKTYNNTSKNFLFGSVNVNDTSFTILRFGKKFRIDSSIKHGLHLHYGVTNALRDLHRTRLLNFLWYSGVGVYNFIRELLGGR